MPIPEAAQSIRLATTVLETTLVSATQDMNPEVERRISRDQERHVKVSDGQVKVSEESSPICLQRQRWWGRS